MNLWLRVLAALGLKAAAPSPQVFFSQLARWSGEAGVPAPQRYLELVKRYGTSAWVYAAVHRKAVDEAAIPLGLARARGRGKNRVLEPVEDAHPLLELLDVVNPFWTYPDLVEINAINLDLSGNDFWLIFPGLGGLPAEIWPLRPDWVTVVADPARFVRGYLVSVDGAPAQPFEPIATSQSGAGVLHFKRSNPWNYWYGQGALAPSWQATLTDEASTAYRYAFYKNSGRPDGVLTSEKPLQPTDVEQIQEWWRDAFKGFANAHRVAVLDNGFKYAAISTTPKDADVQRDRELSREDILVSYGVSLAVLGIETGDVGRRDEQIRHYWDSVVKPNVLRRASTLTEFLAPRFGEDLVVVPDFSGVKALQEDELRAAQIDQIRLNGGVVTVNEVRARLGLEPVAWGDEPFSPLASAFAASAALGPEGAAPPAPPKLWPGFALNGGGRRATAWPRDLDERAALWEGIVAKAGPSERGMRRALTKALRAAGQRTKEEMDAGAAGSHALERALGHFKQEARAVALDWLPEGMEDGWREAIRLLRAALRAGRALALVGAKAGPGKAEQVLAGVDFDLQIPGLAEYLAQRPRIYADLVTATLSGEMRALMADFVASGATTVGVAEAVAEAFDNISDARARTIARTELVAASNLARFEAYRTADVVAAQEWLSARDERVRVSHAVADGQRVPLGATFDVGGAALKYPGDPAGPPEEIINCFLPGTRIAGAVEAVLQARYAGPAREIQTARGYRLAVTPNHPVLTRRGWLPAQVLREGDELLSYRTGIGEGSVQGYIYDDDAPAQVDEIFEALAANGRERATMITALDLHGDARWADRQVYIIRADGGLLTDREPSAPQPVGEPLLRRGDPREARHHRSRSADLDRERVPLPSAPTPRRPALAFDGRAIGFEARPLQALGFGSAATWDVPLLEKPPEDHPAIRRFSAELQKRSAGQVSSDQVVGIRDFDFRGHVYDLQSPYGWIIAEGIVSSNCRCVALPVLEED